MDLGVAPGYEVLYLLVESVDHRLGLLLLGLCVRRLLVQLLLELLEPGLLLLKLGLLPLEPGLLLLELGPLSLKLGLEPLYASNLVPLALGDLVRVVDAIGELIERVRVDDDVDDGDPTRLVVCGDAPAELVLRRLDLPLLLIDLLLLAPDPLPRVLYL